MKSTVLITAVSAERRYTAASSLVSNPTSRLGSLGMTSSFSASDRSAGPILAAHPQVRDMPIRVFFFRKNIAPSFAPPRVPLLDRNGGKIKFIESFIAAKWPPDQIDSINWF
jgi:hypothetical protein